MSQHGSLSQWIALGSLWTLLWITTASVAQEESDPAAQPTSTSSQASSDPTRSATGKGATDETRSDPTKGGAAKKASDKLEDEIGLDIPSKLKAKKKEERKPNFEIRAVRTSPSDTITYFKSNHWTMFHLELIANNSDEMIEVRTTGESLLEAMDTPHSMLYRRIVPLFKEQLKLSRLPVFLPERKGKAVEFALYYPNGVLPIQPPGIERQPCTLLEADQFLIVALSADPDKYRFLNSYQCVLPGNDALDEEPNDKRRYYHLVTPFQPTRPLVADTALAWTTTASVVWDDLDPGKLSTRQQEALVDWLHWGGRLIVSGGSAATRLEQSFLTPYLPADVVGSAQVTDLSKLSATYKTARTYEKREAQAKPIPINADKPVYLAKLAPRPEAERVPDSDTLGDDLPLIIERKVGRGRVVMAAFSLYQPELVLNWKEAYDTFWRERLFGAAETEPNNAFQLRGQVTRTYVRVPARKLSDVRFLTRDLGAGTHKRRPVAPEKAKSDAEPLFGETERIFGAVTMPEIHDTEEKESVAEWRDTTPVPGAARQTLLAAAGIKIPPPNFVLGAAISYLVVLVPLNWLVCRFGFRRPELAWLSAPLIILLFSVGIIRFARVNVGYDSTVHEIDVVEMFAGYPRGHLTRFTCVYTGSRERYQFRYQELGALALPMSIGDVQRGLDVERIHLDWDMVEGVPVTLGRYEVHPRSIGMVRAEEMLGFGGAIHVTPGSAPGRWTIDNQTGWELWDCHLVTETETVRLGDLSAGGQFDFPPARRQALSAEDSQGASGQGRVFELDGFMAGHSTTPELGDLSPLPLLAMLEDRSLDTGTRLVAWSTKTVPGQLLHPETDRAQGFTVFVIHLNLP